MFGKTKETSDIDGRAELDITIDDFFGDEGAAAETVRVDHLHHRVTQVEQQISSQFTSLAAYAQIAQEQVELVRAEARHTSERSEQRVIGLIERERADRLQSGTGGGTDVSDRLDALDAQVAEIRDGLQQCLSNQRALADAITDLFQPTDAAAAPNTTTADAPDSESESVMPAQPIEMPAPLTVARKMASQDATLPPPPLHSSSDDDLDEQLEMLGIRTGLALADVAANDVDDVAVDASDASVGLEPIEAERVLVHGPIAGLSLA